MSISPIISTPSPTSREKLDHLNRTTLAALAALDEDTEDTQDTGAERAELQRQLVRNNMPVAQRLARHYANRGVDPDDLTQVAYYGLVSAARRYDPTVGDSFLAYAVPTIRGELRKAFRDQGWVVRPPRRLQELQARAWATQNELTHELRRSPTVRELAERLDVSLDEVAEMLAIDGCFAPSSLDKTVGEADSATLGDLQGGEDPGFEQSEARTMLGPVVRKLKPRDRRIVELRYFHNLTQQQIGEEIGVTQMQVSRLLSRILRDLRRDLAIEVA